MGCFSWLLYTFTSSKQELLKEDEAFSFFSPDKDVRGTCMKLYDFSLQNMWQLQEMQGTEQAQLLKNYIFCTFLLNSGWHKASRFWIHCRYITCWRFCTSSRYAWGHLEASLFIIRFPLIDSRLSLHLIPLSIIAILKFKSVNGKQLLMQMLPDETSR